MALNRVSAASRTEHGRPGLHLDAQGIDAEALRQNLEVVRLAPTDVNSHRNLAVFYQRLGIVTQAISETQTAIKLAPTDTTLQDMLKQLQPQPVGPAPPVTNTVPQATPTPTPSARRPIGASVAQPATNSPCGGSPSRLSGAG